MRKIIGLILLVVCCNTWAGLSNATKDDYLGNYWIGEYRSQGGYGAVFLLFCDKEKKNCDCYLKPNADSTTVSKINCPDNVEVKKK